MYYARASADSILKAIFEVPSLYRYGSFFKDWVRQSWPWAAGKTQTALVGVQQTGGHTRREGQINGMGCFFFWLLPGRQLGNDLVVTLDLLLLGGR